MRPRASGRAGITCLWPRGRVDILLIGIASPHLWPGLRRRAFGRTGIAAPRVGLTADVGGNRTHPPTLSGRRAARRTPYKTHYCRLHNYCSFNSFGSAVITAATITSHLLTWGEENLVAKLPARMTFAADIHAVAPTSGPASPVGRSSPRSSIAVVPLGCVGCLPRASPSAHAHAPKRGSNPLADPLRAPTCPQASAIGTGRALRASRTLSEPAPACLVHRTWCLREAKVLLALCPPIGPGLRLASHLTPGFTLSLPPRGAASRRRLPRILMCAGRRFASRSCAAHATVFTDCRALR